MIPKPQKTGLLAIVLVLGLFPILVKCQETPADFTFGLYVPADKDTALLFRSKLLLNKDFSFVYESISKLKDRQTGTFQIIDSIIILKYSDGIDENYFERQDKSLEQIPIEMIGERFTKYGRYYKLIWRKDSLYRWSASTEKLKPDDIFLSLKQ